MKKFWKNLCTYSLAMTCGISFVGCGKDNNNNVSRDLDGDGVVSSWETVFESEGASNRIISAESVVEIASYNDLVSINNNADGIHKVYKLVRNIDCGGQELSIDLDVSEFYGNNKVISNFKLGAVKFMSNPEEGKDRVEITSAPTTRALFYNGAGLYDLRVFMGNQKFELDESSTSDVISPFVNTPALDNVEVKGNIEITKQQPTERGVVSELKSSLMYSCARLDESLVSYYKTTSIRDCVVDGKITLIDTSAKLVGYIGGIASILNEDSLVYDSYACVNIHNKTNNEVHSGGLVGKNSGFISTCVTTGDITWDYHGAVSTENMGGIVGYNAQYGEIKNCSTNMNITSAMTENSVKPNDTGNNLAKINIGGIVGYSESGIMTYVRSDANIRIDNVHRGLRYTLGGICGVNIKGDLNNVISAGSIDVNNPHYLMVANLAGRSIRGTIQSAVVTTAINVNTQGVDKSHQVAVGGVTIFEELEDGELSTDMYSGELAPLLKGVLLGSKDTVVLGKDAVFEYNLGIRNSFKANTGTTVDEEIDGEIVPVPVYVEKFPAVFDLVYVFNNYVIKTNYDESDANYYQSTELKDIVPVYSSIIQTPQDISTSNSTIYLPFLTDNLGFKTYLNHKEVVSSGAENDFNSISFKLPVENQLIKHYNEKRYNGELVYFDSLFEEYYNHSEGILGGCPNDVKDELFSYLNFRLPVESSYRASKIYDMRFTSSYLNIDYETDTLVDRLENFRSIITSTLECMGLTFSNVQWITTADKVVNLEDITSIGGENIRFLKLNLSSSELVSVKTWMFDVSDLLLDNTTGEYDFDEALDKPLFDIKLIIPRV